MRMISIYPLHTSRHARVTLTIVMRIESSDCGWLGWVLTRQRCLVADTHQVGNRIAIDEERRIDEETSKGVLQVEPCVIR